MMMRENDPAFPGPHGNTVHGKDTYAPGMTYRAWLVGMALQGVMANPAVKNPKERAALAVEAADNTIMRFNATGG